MMNWWRGMAPRERTLILIAGALSAVLLVWQALLVPMMTTRAEARLDLQEADRTLSSVQEAYAQRRARTDMPTATQTSQVLSGDAFKSAVTNAATQRGLSISRLQGRSENAVGVVFESSDPRLIFLWLEDVELRLGGSVTRLVMEQAGGGMVRTSADISAGESG